MSWALVQVISSRLWGQVTWSANLQVIRVVGLISVGDIEQAGGGQVIWSAIVIGV